MKITVHDLNGKAVRDVDAPAVFSTPVRPDVIKRAVLAAQSHRRQPYATDVMAGKRTSAHYHGRRATHNSMMNKEMARTKRIHEQGFLNLTARFVPQAVKGREAHPPKLEKVWAQKINDGERRLATRSAIAATCAAAVVSERGHRINGVGLPLVVEDALQSLKKSGQVKEALGKQGLAEELARASERKVRAGRGKMRGRKYRKKVGPLIVIMKDDGVRKAGSNIPGVDVVLVQNLCAEYLAPGAKPGRLTVWTESAVKKLNEMFGG